MREKDIENKNKKEREEDRGARMAAIVLSALCAAVLLLTSADSERYHSDAGGVAVSGITFTPPERQKPPGLWDIFSSAVKDLFYID